MIKLCYYMVLAGVGFIACHLPGEEPIQGSPLSDTTEIKEKSVEFSQLTGKDLTAEPLPTLYSRQSLDSLELPVIENDLIEALEFQLKSLRIKKQKEQQKLGNLSFSLEDLAKTIEQLLSWQYAQPLGLSKVLDAHQIWGEDQRGNVLFTGYFAPMIKISRTKTNQYKYPIYSRPKVWSGPYPTREEIDAKGALAGRGLEVAYAQSKMDIYFMQIQGSGYAAYKDGERILLAYDGSNRHPYRSIGRYLSAGSEIKTSDVSMSGLRRFFIQNPQLVDSVLFVNPSYTFFTPQKSRPRGAGLVPLTGSHSIAVDRRYIPLGACLLAQVPLLDVKGKFLGHEYRVLLAQDIGGAIKGPGHIDLFTGSGTEGRIKASRLRHYGKIWLLLPRKDSASEDQVM